MDTQNQFFVFLLCICVGFLGGILYEPFALARLVLGCERGKSKPLGVALDVLYWLCFALLTVLAAFVFRFPEFRTYMWIGYALGGIIYAKTLRKIVAFLENMCYNKIIKVIKKAKKKEKNLPKEVDKRV